jgi:hypothetical protein
MATRKRPAPTDRKPPPPSTDPGLAKRLANIKAHAWKPGQSGNPSGKSTALNTIMRQAREHAPECIERLMSIVRNPKASDRDVIQAALAILDRGLGKPIVPIFRGQNALPEEMVSGGEGDVTPLISIASRGNGDAYRRQLREELARLDNEAEQAKAVSRNEIDEDFVGHQYGPVNV